MATKAVKAQPPRKRSYNQLTDKTVICIVGPTASGKTAAAIQLARTLGAKIISADSRQCFRELHIGVAKPSPAELLAIPHYFIDSHAIQQDVTAALFEELSLQWAAEIFRDADNAVLVGGTGLYIQAFCEGLDPIPPTDPAIRQEIRSQFAAGGMPWLQEQVRTIDPDFYSRGEIQNPQRLMRALEVKRSTGHSILSLRTAEKKQRPFRIQKIGLETPKEELHRRINERVDRMMDAGLLDEARSLIPYRDLNALHTLGYTELFRHLDGDCSLEQAVEEIKKNTRHYAKRQMTWFKKDPSIKWVKTGGIIEKA
jgi:tRNA dimethylallyltransferase